MSRVDITETERGTILSALRRCYGITGEKISYHNPPDLLDRDGVIALVRKLRNAEN